MATKWTHLALVCVVVLSVGAGSTGTAAAASTSRPVAVYTDTVETVSVLYANGSTTTIDVDADVAAVGPMANFDDDSALEAPVVGEDGTLWTVDTAGDVRTVVAGGVVSSKTYLPNGDWNGDGDRAVFYETTDGTLYRVEPGSSPEPVVGPDGDPLATNAPVGVADYDGDGDRDVVFLGSSSTVKYYDGESVASTGFSSFGANNGLGIGAPADFDGDGTPRVPYVTGSNNLALLAADGTKTKVTPNYGGAAKAPVAAGDWTGDDAPELLHVNSNSGEMYYATLSGDVGAVEALSGTAVRAAPGVVPVSPPPAPSIRDFEATNPSGRNVSVSFTSSDPLTDIVVEVTGPENATLTEAAFTGSGDGPYRYTATYAAPTDGTYTATLTRAENERGVDGSTGQQSSVTIDTPAPTVTDVTVSDADGNGVVGDGDRVRVTATVESEGEITSVTADASAFGAGTVSLARTSDGYGGSFTVRDGATSGDASVEVTATNEYGYTDSATSGPLVVDTTPPTADAGTGQTVPAGTTANFDAAESVDDSRIVRYAWSFGDGTSATGVTAAHTYERTGTYTVTLTVTDAAGHTATDSITVTVTEANVTVTARPTASATAASTAARSTEPGGGSDATARQVRIDTASAGEVVVTPGPGRSVTVTFANLSANQPVSANYRDVAPLTESAPIQGIRFVPERSGDASMTVEGLASPPAGVPSLSSRPGVTAVDYVRVDHSIANERVHGVAFTLVVPKDRLGNATDPSAVSLYRYRDGRWTPHAARTVAETPSAVTYRVRVPGLSVYGVGVQQPPVRVVDADLARSSSTVGETVTVTAVLENNDTTRSTRRVSLVVNGSVRDTMEVSLAPDERRTVSFVYEPARAGEYSVSVENVPAGTLSVGAPPWLPWAWLRWILALGAVVLAFTGGYATRRWREPGRGPPLPEIPENQRQTLIAAYESGYFDVPRNASLDELADRLDLSEQDVSLRLRRGLDTLLSASLTDERSDADGDVPSAQERDRLDEGGMEWGPDDRGGRNDG